MSTGTKPGIKTSELWLTLAFNIVIAVSAFASSISPKWAAFSSAISIAAYNYSRGKAKSGTG